MLTLLVSSHPSPNFVLTAPQGVAPEVRSFGSRGPQRTTLGISSASASLGAALVGASAALASSRSLKTKRAAKSSRKPKQAPKSGKSSSVSLLERGSNFPSQLKESPSTKRSSKAANPSKPAATSSSSATTIETAKLGLEPERPKGSTLTKTATGEKVVFARGLIGGNSALYELEAYNFDPLGFADKLPGMLPWFREAELKHGRIAMLAFVGLIAPEITGPLPGLPAKCSAAGTFGESLVFEAHQYCAVDQLPFINVSPLAVMLFAAGTIEVVTTAQKIVLGWGWTVENAGDYPGRKEIGGYLNQLPKNELAMVTLKLQELKHCRLAMLAFGGAWTQACLTGNGFPYLW